MRRLSYGPCVVQAPPTELLSFLAAAVGVALPLYAWRTRGGPFAIYAAVLVLFSFPAALALGHRLQELLGPGVSWVFGYALLAAGINLSSLVRARLRRRWYRYAVSFPGMAFVALGLLCVPYFAIVLSISALFWIFDAHAATAALRWLDLLPVAIILGSIAQSLHLRREIVRVRLGGVEPDQVTRVPLERFRKASPASERRPLRVVQITDPHLGPWQPVHRLQRRITELLKHEPDLVLLTGDFLTMEGRGSPGALADAFAPLREMPGRCFAIFGNHDHEAPEEVREALRANGIPLLIDEEACVETPAGRVQLVGADYRHSERAKHIQGLLERYPRREDHLRLFLLHDPLGFREIPKGDVDLTLSGHTHGGQVGLVSIGLDWTVLSRSRWPDHGLFGHGRNRLYVHRGTGFYGFPLRMGVPGEASLLEIIPESA